MIHESVINNKKYENEKDVFSIKKTVFQDFPGDLICFGGTVVVLHMFWWVAFDMYSCDFED